MVFARLLLVLLLSSLASGCFRAKREPVSGGVILTNPNDVIGTPPTPQPTLAPPTPGPKTGWIVPPPDADQMLFQSMSRTNCLKEQHTEQEDGEMVEKWSYTCSFAVCVQVDTTDSGGLCGCGIYAENPSGGNYADSPDTVYNTAIEDFKLVILDTKTGDTLYHVREWDLGPAAEGEMLGMMAMMNPEDAKVQGLKDAINGDMNYAGAFEAFQGEIGPDAFDDAAKALLYDPARSEETAHLQYNVAAICFGVVQVYKTKSKWRAPRTPKMGIAPAAWSTECMPVQTTIEVPGGGDEGSGKRGFVDQKYWAREFLVFNGHDGTGSVSGQIVYDRHITSYYSNNLCSQGLFSFDVRFSSVVDDQRNYEEYDPERFISGAFAWKREIAEVYVVGSTPINLEIEPTYPNDFRRVIWDNDDAQSRDVDHRYAPGKVAALLAGDCTLLGDKVFDAGFNMDVYPAWPSCDTLIPETLPGLCQVPPATVGDPEVFSNAIPEGEIVRTWDENNVYFYRIANFGQFSTDAEEPVAGSTLVCSGMEDFCKSQTVILTFQNFAGANAREFSKQARSWMVTGPRDYSSMCTNSLYGGKSAEEFSLSTNAFKPWGYAAIMQKRGIRQDEESMGLVQTRDGGFAPMGSGTNSPYDTPVGEGGVTDAGVGFQIMAGSVEGGDHPLTLFPEAYAAPVSLDPFDLNFDKTVRANSWNGRPPPCQFGTLGCGCRPEASRGARPLCDTPLTCSFSGYCEVPSCPAGELGCSCGSGCGEGAVCDTEHDTCVFKITCDAGEPGCDALLKDGMPGTELSHYTCKQLSSPIETNEGFVCGFQKCLEDAPGCTCDANNTSEDSCSGRAGSCENGMCKGEVADGTYGGGCRAGDSPCDDGFVCKEGVCTIPECVPGTSGCLCKEDNTCDEGACGIAGRCLIDRCEPGFRGCECLHLNCEGGYECVTSQLLGSYRCVEKKCPIGSAGCPCKDDGSCEKDKFECKAMRRNGDDKRCVNDGVDCSEDNTELCTAFCGKGNVKYCPPCTGETPECIDNPASVTYLSMVVAIATIAFAMF